jgi:hypothetical protein
VGRGEKGNGEEGGPGMENGSRRAGPEAENRRIGTAGL